MIEAHTGFEPVTFIPTTFKIIGYDALTTELMCL